MRLFDNMLPLIGGVEMSDIMLLSNNLMNRLNGGRGSRSRPRALRSANKNIFIKCSLTTWCK